MNTPGQHILTELSKENLTLFQKVFEIPGNYIFQSLDYFDKNFDFFIYQSKPSENIEYLNLGKIFEIELPLKDLIKLDSILSEFRENVKAGDIVDDIPLFFGYMKFPSSVQQSLWKNFLDVSWILPESIVFRKNNKVFFADIFLANSDEKNDHSSKKRELEKLIAELIRLEHHSKNIPSIKKISVDDKNSWNSKVNEAISKIQKESIKKIVLSRKVDFEISGELSWSDVFSRLNNDYPECFNFLIKSNSDYFFGSSPELLASFNKSEFKTEALAGSIDRGNDEYEDTDFALLLSASRKNKKEHEIVIEHLRDSLNQHLHNIDIDETPSIKRLKNIQHLQTKISGKLKEQGKYFDIIKNIFPTPAVCGFPTNQSLKELKTLEDFDRGLYSGVVGYFDLTGKAEFYVSLRSALLSGNKLSAFAGCGIVEGSNPDEEFQETELKLKPITSLFSDEN